MSRPANRSMPASTVIPVLAYPDVRAAVAWLSEAFGFVERLQIGEHRSQLEFGDGAVVVTGGADGGLDGGGHSVMVRVADAQAHYELGLIHKRRREFAEAAERFKTAAQIDPTDVDSHYQLGRMAREEGHHEEAIRHFEEVVRRDEAHSRHEIWREIGATYVASTSWPNARWALEKYTAARPHDPEGLFLLGEALSGMGAGSEAQDAYRRCIEAVDTMPPFRRSEVSRFRRQARKRLGA